jgi:hypothetical protein
MKISAVTTGAYEELCYIVWNTENQALVLDPGHGPDTTIETERVTHFFMK